MRTLKFFLTALSILALCFCITRPANAGSGCTSISSGNWGDAGTWSCDKAPDQNDDVIIQAGHLIMLDVANAEAHDITLAGGSNVGLLMLNGNSLSIYGTLDASSTPGTNTILGGGLVRFVGSSRTLFGAGWDATTPSWNLEIALTPGETGTSAVPVKAGTIKISSGIFETTGDVQPDNGAANSGTLTIASGATLRIAGNIARTATVTDQSASVTVNGTLEQSGTNLSAVNININSGGVYRVTGASGVTITGTLNYANGSTLEYAGSAAQITSNELTASVHHLTINNTNGVTLTGNVIVNGDLNLTAGDLTTGANTLTQDSSSTCSGDGEVIGTVLRNSISDGTPHCFGNADNQITFNNPALSNVTVRLDKTMPAGVEPTKALARVYTITTSGSFTDATLQLRYESSEVPVTVNESQLQAFKQSGTTRYLEQNGTLTQKSGCGYVVLNGVTSFSKWAFAEHNAVTAVGLNSFNAKANHHNVALKWITGTELNIMGFNVWHQAPNGVWKKLNTDLISAQNLGGVTGATYTYRDIVKRSGTHKYKLQIMRPSGSTEWSKVARVQIAP